MQEQMYTQIFVVDFVVILHINFYYEFTNQYEFTNSYIRKNSYMRMVTRILAPLLDLILTRALPDIIQK